MLCIVGVWLVSLSGGWMQREGMRAGLTYGCELVDEFCGGCTEGGGTGECDNDDDEGHGGAGAQGIALRGFAAGEFDS
jgi:hypothetical protein